MLHLKYTPAKLKYFVLKTKYSGHFLFISFLAVICTPYFALFMQPDIYIGALRIAEPVIALTGLGIAAVCVYAYRRLARRPEQTATYRWMMRFFLLMAASSVVGPFWGHAFNYWAGFTGKYACWIFSIFSLGALAQASVEHARPLLAVYVYRGLTLLNLLCMSVAITVSGLIQGGYLWMVGHSALVMLGFMLPLQASVFAKRRDPGSRLLLWSLPVAILSFIPVVLKWSPDIWFTYFDLGHVLLYPFFWIMMLGTERMKQYGQIAK